MSDARIDLELNWAPARVSGKPGVLNARLGDESFTDQLHVTSAKGRATMIKQLIEKWPGLESVRDDIETRLSGYADEEASRLADADDGSDRKGAASRLADAVMESGVELFRDQGDGDDARGFISIQQDGVRCTHLLRSTAAERWIGRLAHKEGCCTPSSSNIGDAIAILEAESLFGEVQHRTATRVAGEGNVLWVDLGDDTWRVVRIDAKGWSVVNAVDCPVRFYRRRGMIALPVPQKGGSIDELRGFVNVSDDQSWALMLGWILGAWTPEGPYPILEISGEPGSAKSTTARLLRRLIDPNRADIRSQPRNEHDLVIAASNGWMLALDNLSYMPPWLSDGLCRIATGSGFATRELYTDDGEKLFQVCRPIVLTGVENLAAKSDLLDRTIRITLDRISDEMRRTERELMAAFDEARPRILGALFDAVSCALKRRDEVTLARLPRLADWARWATAAEPALGLDDGAIMDAFDADRGQVHIDAVEASPIGPALLQLLDRESGVWSGTASDLLAELDAIVESPRSKSWPRNPRKVSGDLRYIAQNLRAMGFTIEFKPVGHNKTRMIYITYRGPSADAGRPSAGPPQPSATTGDSSPAAPIADGADDADGPSALPFSNEKKNYWEAGA